MSKVRVNVSLSATTNMSRGQPLDFFAAKGCPNGKRPMLSREALEAGLRSWPTLRDQAKVSR